ncbi:toprim domain-containing protein [Desulfoprunum benzoelyticum]|uniref:Energy-coupling factor transporter ATP-binding protein EcfA2 n=1 Tax=Desulfoprunum benzoelyticum TaxID=1506996 RepID=A0A840V2B8_9BACT|nr:toprim domain-containing protein [Desulfoprunum benzoelyticum]MBB5348978.1 energy-coupling factor transporter ATP-binding protein EcfA2 [Desulfoprunum benzoelyticum]MBM9528861.1 toprim domain-containing protein [Desulfoprunum benzoelyticum]
MTLNEKLLDALRQSPYWTEKTRSNGNTIQQLICPACGDTKAWAYAARPMSINCNRGSKCGIKKNTFELFPEVRRNIERDFPATKADPHRPAREYLLSRGFSPAILEHLDYRYLKNVRKTGSGAVMFPVGKDEKGKEVLNGRLFSPPPGDGKTHNIGSTTGKYWKHPTIPYDPEKKTWIVEGVLNALSLLELGEQAIAVLSSGQDPAKVDLSEYKFLVLSFDNDAAGHRACKKWHLEHPAAAVILCDQGQDWNDLLQSGTPEQVKNTFSANTPRYILNGKLALAGTAQEYADHWSNFFNTAPGLFAFQGSTYFSEKKIPRGGNAEDAFISVSRCFKGVARVISFILDRSNPARPEYVYHLEIQPVKGRAIEATATGKDLASHRSLKEWFLTYAKINFEGDAKACTALASKISDDKKAPEVKQLTVSGYQPETGNYIFSKWATDTSGKILLPDKRGNFQVGYNQHFRPPTHSEEKAIFPAEIGKDRVKEIHGVILSAWGLNGVVALSWVIAGWFVNQVKATTDFFPFLSLHGDPASGKSALVTTMNAIQGRDIEGLPITQLNSRKGLTRTIGQVSGLFTALLEDSHRNEKGFDYSILLTAYNRGPLQVQAAFSNDLQTKEAPFLGSLLFCQNTEPFNTKQEKQRVISLHFQAEQLTDNSRKAYTRIIDTDNKELAGILRQVLTHRQHFAAWGKEYEKAIEDLSPMDERRILQNHALILAFHRLFCSCFGIDQDGAVPHFLKEIGKKKCITSAIRQTSLADHFFELLDEVKDDKLSLACHYDNEKGHIYVNLPKAENLIRNKGINIQVNENLSLALQKHPAYLRNSYRFRFPEDPDTDETGRPKQRRVWVFDLPWFKKDDA